MSDILEQIATEKRLEVQLLKQEFPEDLLGRSHDDRLSFSRSLAEGSGPRIIAEIKKASPSKGILLEEFDPEDLAAKYRRGGAAALSVLTESKHFLGRLEYMQIAKQAARLPVLCKDFVVDPYQIALAAHHGADAVLLIVKLLTRKTLQDYIQRADALGIDSLVEVHTEDELVIALDCGARIIGVNSRNLRTFEVDLAVAERVGAMIPDSIIKIAESGVSKREEIAQLSQSGYRCFLIGEALVRHPNPTALLQELTAP